MSRSGLPTFFAFLLMSLLTICGKAQVNVATATLKGTVTDPSGAVIPGATLTIRSIDRGVSRQAATNENGEYQIPLLNPGVYEIGVEADGFRAQVMENTTLTVGQIFVQNFELELGKVEKRYVATAEAPLVEPERSQQSNTIERKQIENLPNLSRVFTEYIYTLPGVVNTDIARLQNTRISQVRNSGFSIGGGNGQLNYVTVDGGENEYGTGALRIRNLSIEAVQEFQVNRNAFSAEFGFTTGTAINVITRGGGNNFHGGVYAYYRSHQLAARNALDFNQRKPYAQRMSRGFSLSGPIKKNRAFFFTSYEGLKLDESYFRSYISADPSLLAPTAPQAAYFQTLTTGPNATDQTRRIAATLRAGLTGAGAPQALQLLRANEGFFSAPARDHNWTTRVDYELSSSNSFNGRYTFSDEDRTVPGFGNLDSASRARLEDQHDYTMVGTWNHIFNEGLYNQFRVQFAKNRYSQDTPDPSGTALSISGLINTGADSVTPVTAIQERYQFEDTLALTRGRHNFKFGVSYRPAHVRIDSQITYNSFFQFNSGLPLVLPLSPVDQAALTGPLAPPATTALTSAQSFFLQLPVAWVQGFGNGVVDGVQQTLGFFEQDSWKINPRFTLNYGLRLDFEGAPAPINNHFYGSPRLGFAWDVMGDAKTVVRGGAGMFYAPSSAQVFGALGLQNDREDRLIVASRTLLDGPQSSAAIWAYGLALGKLPTMSLTEADIRAFGLGVSPKQPGRRVADAVFPYQNPYSVQSSLGVSRLIAGNLSLDLAYQFYRGVHLPIAAESNYRESGQSVAVPGSDQGFLFGPQLVPIDPTIASRILYSSSGNSVYHGMTASLNTRVARRVQFSANYTFSKSIDDALDYQGLASPFLPTRRSLDRSVSAFDTRHNFVASGVFSSPFTRGAGRPWYARAFSDLTLSPIVFVRSGFPFTLYLGTDVNGDSNAADRPFYAPRNSGRGAGFVSANLRLNKRFYLRNVNEGVYVEFIAETSNLFNHTNFLRVNDSVCGSVDAPGAINGCDPKFLTGPFDFKGRSDAPGTSPLGFVNAAPGRTVQFGLKIAY